MRVHGKFGSITSPNFPSSYPKNVTCTWNITADLGHILNMTFVSMDIENSPGCMKDYVQMRLGSSASMQRYCNSVPGIIFSEDGWVQIVFTSDGNGENSGFNLTWVAMKARQGLLANVERIHENICEVRMDGIRSPSKLRNLPRIAVKNDSCCFDTSIAYI